MRQQLPNILTVGRLALCLVMFAAFAAIAAIMARVSGGQGSVDPIVGLILAWTVLIAFVVAAVTDFLDGYLARKWDVVSTFGAILDPIADKVLVCGAILGLLVVDTPGVLIPGGLILFREFAVSAMREVLAPKGIKLPVTFLAKTKTALQLISLGGLILFWFWPAWGITGLDEAAFQARRGCGVLLWLAAAVTVWTGIEYAAGARKALKATV